MRRTFLWVVLAACSSQPPPAQHVELAAAPVSVSSSSPPALAQPTRALAAATCGTPVPDTDPKRPLATPATLRARNVMSPGFSGGTGFYRVTGAAPSPRTSRDAPVELRLSAPARVAFGDAVGFTLTFASTSRAPVVLLRPLDGSLEHWRDPGYELYLRDEASGDVYLYAFHGGRCGNVNSIAKDDYVSLAPGQSRADLADNGWAPYFKDATIGRSGTYTAWAVYRECGAKGGVALGKDFVRADLHVGVHASNAVRLVVQ